MSDDLPGSPATAPDGLAAPHAVYEACLERGVLAFQACARCSAAIFPPRGRCSRCGADALTWRASAGRATVYSTTVLTPRDRAAYAVVLVDLDEGYRMMSRIDDSDVAIDECVTVEIAQVDGRALPLFVRNGGDR